MKQNKTKSFNSIGIECRLEAILVVLSEILSQLANKTGGSGPIEGSKGKAVAILVKGGVTQEKAAKLLSMQKERAVKALKKIKI